MSMKLALRFAQYAIPNIRKIQMNLITKIQAKKLKIIRIKTILKKI